MGYRGHDSQTMKSSLTKLCGVGSGVLSDRIDGHPPPDSSVFTIAQKCWSTQMGLVYSAYTAV